MSVTMRLLGNSLVAAALAAMPVAALAAHGGGGGGGGGHGGGGGGGHMGGGGGGGHMGGAQGGGSSGFHTGGPAGVRAGGPGGFQGNVGGVHSRTNAHVGNFNQGFHASTGVGRPAESWNRNWAGQVNSSHHGDWNRGVNPAFHGGWNGGFDHFGHYGHGFWPYAGWGLGLGWGRPWYGWGWGWGYPWYGRGWGGGYWPGYASSYGYPYYSNDLYADYGSSVTPYTAAYAPEDTTATPDMNAANPESSEYFGQAVDAFQSGDYKDALRFAGHAAVDNPQDPSTHVLLSLGLFASGDYRGAAMEAHGLAALGKIPDWNMLYGYYGRLPPYETQLRALEKFVSQNPSAPEGRFLLGFHYLMEGHQNAAKGEFLAGLKLAPEDPVAAQLLTSVGGQVPPDIAERLAQRPKTPSGTQGGAPPLQGKTKTPSGSFQGSPTIAPKRIVSPTTP